ncbi:toll-like receptor 13 [Coregonus clupeaformis]|uniref:toll-like receptor 13 n=1 Tax=Coregonus clupeaformis TaxID=59861 RepID=UPI001E1C2C0F|nr:toll-like receptor 13 [Coregonus clupeaformis]
MLHMSDNMGGQKNKILVSVAIVLHIAQITVGYSFRNCTEDPTSNHTKFLCIRHQAKNISTIVGDLPPYATTVIISINLIKHIPDNTFVHLPNLRMLQIDNNHLETIDNQAFQNMSQLKSLNLSLNKISHLSSSVFQDLKNLVNLSLNNNSLIWLPPGIFSSLSNLDALMLRQNYLNNFSAVAESVTHLPKLTKLDLCNNYLTSLQHSNHTDLPESLTTLYLCKNKLVTLECKWGFLSHILLLDLSYNDQLPSRAFQGVDLRKLNYMRLRSTNVTVPELLNVSNVRAGNIDFSGMGLKTHNLLMELCHLLSTKVKFVEKLSLGSNGILSLRKNTLSNCPPIRGLLDLSFNQLRKVRCLHFLKGQDQIKNFTAEKNHLTSLMSCNRQNLSFPNLTDLSYRYNRILNVNSFAFHHTPNVKTLQLNINIIAYLDHKAFSGLTSLVTLRLDNNLLTDLYNDSFEDLQSLEILNLRNNQIAVIFNKTFHSLKYLHILDLGGNKITHFQESAFVGLDNLANFYLDGNNLKQIDSAKFKPFHATLEVLDLHGNQVSFSSKRTNSPFVNLTKLRNLKLDAQMPHGLNVLPHAFFRGLSSLQSLYLTDNHIFSFAADTFDDLTNLTFLSLDNSCAGVMQLHPGVFKNLRKLSKLSARNMGIQSFSNEVFGNLTELQILLLNQNVMQTLDVNVLEALPKLRYLDLRNIPLSCTCLNSDLQNWTLTNQRVQLVLLYSLQCQDKKLPKNFYNFDTNVCYLDLGEYLFATTTTVILLLTIIPLLYNKLYWKLKYSYYVFRSWFGQHWRRLREKEEHCKYDAFISYNSADEPWVLDQLLPNLEGNGASFRLCLHHRDFELGRNIVDNIVSSVYSSRKTICVVSRHFLRSEWCSLEIQLASYRLFHELRDVLLLIFLEPIPERQLSAYHRMRKVMLKKTYLQWPGSDCTDPVKAQELFWNHLRRALRNGSSRFEEEDEGSEDYFNQPPTDDDKYYLMP